MANYLHINFFLRKSLTNPATGSIYVRTTVNNKRLTLGAVASLAGLPVPKVITIQCANWDIDRQRVKRADLQSTIVNKCIEECERKLDKLYHQHEGYEVAMTVKGVKNSIRNGGNVRPTMADLIEKFLAERTALKFKKSTVDTYRWKFVPLSEFLKHEGIIDQAAEDFSPGTFKRYRTYLITQRGNADRSADKSCQFVKTLLIWAAENELTGKNPLMNVRVRVDKTPNLECLTQEELTLVRNAKLTPALRLAADCFEFACYTGLAYQDMQGLTPDSIQVVEGAYCIVGKRMKTGTEFYIPVSDRVSALMEKYDGINLPLPKLTDYNPLLRQIMLTLGIEKRITSHTARKTFADWCINELNMSEEATIVAMGQKAAKELTPYRKTRPKRLLSEFPSDLLPAPAALQPTPTVPTSPFTHIYKAS